MVPDVKPSPPAGEIRMAWVSVRTERSSPSRHRRGTGRRPLRSARRGPVAGMGIPAGARQRNVRSVTTRRSAGFLTRWTIPAVRNCGRRPAGVRSADRCSISVSDAAPGSRRFVRSWMARRKAVWCRCPASFCRARCAAHSMRATDSFTSSGRAAGRPARCAMAVSSACASLGRNFMCRSGCTRTRMACASPSASRWIQSRPATPAATASRSGTIVTRKPTARRIGPCASLVAPDAMTWR